MKLRTSAVASLILGALSIFALIVCHLALTDIRHGEPDLSLEWKLVQISFAVIIIFIIGALITCIKALKTVKSPHAPEVRATACPFLDTHRPGQSTV
jgi:hypothetical protein